MEYQYEVKFRKEGNKFKLDAGNLFEAEKNSLDYIDDGFYSDFDSSDSDYEDESGSDEISNPDSNDFNSKISSISFEDFENIDPDTLNLQIREEKGFLAGKISSLFQNYPSPAVDDRKIDEEELEQNRHHLRLERMKASKNCKRIKPCS